MDYMDYLDYLGMTYICAASSTPRVRSASVRYTIQERPNLHLCMHCRVHPNESKQTVVSGTPSPLLCPGTESPSYALHRIYTISHSPFPDHHGRVRGSSSTSHRTVYPNAREKPGSCRREAFLTIDLARAKESFAPVLSPALR